MRPEVDNDHLPAKTNHDCHTENSLLRREIHNAAHYPNQSEMGPSDSDSQHNDLKRKIQEEELESIFYLPSDRQVDGKQPEAPDGGWGWVVLVATMLVLALTRAFPACIGIFYTAIQLEFNASDAETCLVPAILVSALYAGGPLCSVLVERYGCRETVMAGGLISGLSTAASSQATTITQILILSGITGLGLCLSFQPSVTILGHYFVRRRVFAMCLSTTGPALGWCFMPLIANVLLSRFGLRGSYMMLGVLLLSCCLCGAVMRPVQSGGKTLNKETNFPLKQKGKGRSNAFDSFKALLRKHLAFDLFRSNPYYRAYCISLAVMMFGLSVSITYVMTFSNSSDNTAILSSILGMLNIAAHPAAAIILSLPCFRGRDILVYALCGAAVTGGFSYGISAASGSFESLLVYVTIFGLSTSLISALMYTVLMDLVELSHFSSALGLLYLLKSSGLLIWPPLAGMLVDLTGQYSAYVFYVSGLCVSSAGLYLAGAFYCLNRKRDKLGPCQSGGSDSYQCRGAATLSEPSQDV